MACSLRGQCCSEADRLLDGLQQHRAEALVEVTLCFLGISSLSSLAQLSLSPDGPVGSEAKMSGGQTPMKEFDRRVLISILDVAKTDARVSARQRVAGTLSAIACDVGLVRRPCTKLATCARQQKLCASQ